MLQGSKIRRTGLFGGFGFDRGMKICEYALSASWLTGSL